VQRIDRIDSAHDTDQLALLEVGWERLHAGQQVLSFDPPASDGAGARAAVVKATSARPLWKP
jgi:hypothetical protein